MSAPSSALEQLLLELERVGTLQRAAVLMAQRATPGHVLDADPRGRTICGAEPAAPAPGGLSR